MISEKLFNRFTKKLNTTIDIRKKMDRFDPKIINLGIGFGVLFSMETENGWFVATGTKDNPSGISDTSRDIVVFVDKHFNVLKISDADDIRRYIKDNWSNIDRGMDEDYKVIGVYIKGIRDK